MKDKRSRLFSLSVKDSKYFNDKEDKIELVACFQLGKECTEHRLIINENFLASRRFLLNKDYPSSIEALKSAFYKAAELQESSCSKCAKLFCSTITKSLENIHEDLQKMSSGLIRNKQYKPSFKLATLALEEFRKKT
ncbi:MAG TPA: hypothetical protein VFC65_08350 [Prolixibacteraceae bacterium]|nr:hypothetical protein [Prolixibacteraceae bacterium]